MELKETNAMAIDIPISLCVSACSYEQQILLPLPLSSLNKSLSMLSLVIERWLKSQYTSTVGEHL